MFTVITVSMGMPTTGMATGTNPRTGTRTARAARPTGPPRRPPGPKRPRSYPMRKVASCDLPPHPAMSATHTSSQRSRLEAFRATTAVDLHCHCLPGLDDGPVGMEDSIALCRALVADGTTVAVATPHQLGKYDLSNTGPAIR